MRIDLLKETHRLKPQSLWLLLFFVAICATLLPVRSAQAGAYVMPISVIPGAGGQGLPQVTQEIIYWDEDNSTLNPCYGVTECWIGPDVLYSSNYPSLRGTCEFYNNCIEISGYRYAYQVMNAFKASKGIPYRAIFDISSSDATCVGLFYVPHRPKNNVFDSQLWPGSTCGQLPPANQFCSISLPSYVDHGSISNSNLNGQIKSVSGTISCTRPASLKVYARSTTGERYVYMNSNSAFYSRPLINNQDGWYGVNISVSGSNVNNPFTFTSELHTTTSAITPGYYTGNSIVIISFN
ncbi:hypothetical protein AB6G07_15380 [Providencia stuartii]|uniref:MrpH family fimbial adhesin n=2 Tax=Providencia stuartii TaxID=588 RepID=UPI0012B63119